MMKINPNRAIVAGGDTLNTQDFLNRKIYQRQETAKRNPNSFWLPTYDDLIRALLDLQAMEGVVHIFYKVNIDNSPILTPEAAFKLAKNHVRFCAENSEYTDYGDTILRRLMWNM